MNWYLKVLKNYANFSGRARRQEYWMFALFNIIFAIVAVGLDFMLSFVLDEVYGIIYIIYALAMVIPSFAVLVRRLHDVGKSGTWFFISFIPLVGSIWLFILLVTDSEPGENNWGPNPKEFTDYSSNDGTIDGDIKL